MRHVLKTVSRRRRQSSEGAAQKLRFFLHESHHEIIARHVLLVQIINNTSLPIRERMELFLSLLGKQLVYPYEIDYVYIYIYIYMQMHLSRSVPLSLILSLILSLYRTHAHRRLGESVRR